MSIHRARRPDGSVRAYIEAEKSDNTRRAYKTDWADFTNWYAAVDLAPLPAELATVARYLAQLADGGKKGCEGYGASTVIT
jgi:hypothetical protein